MFSLKQITLSLLQDNTSLNLEVSEIPGFDEQSDVRVWVEEEEALSGVRWKIFLHAPQKVHLQQLSILADVSYEEVKHVFCNGFQSWSESRLYKKDDLIKGLKSIAKPIMKPYGDYTYYHYPEKKGILHSWAYTYMTLPDKKVLFAGSLDEKQAFTNFIHHTTSEKLLIARDVEGWEIEGEKLIADIFLTKNTERGAFQHYFLLNQWPELKSKPAIGWTSWYHYYTGITEAIIMDNLKAFQKAQLPVDIFQIDDGYQQAVGDWMKVNAKFPNGMAPIATAIKKAGYKPGIWLAPLAAERKSDIFRQKPHWLLKGKDGQPLKIGYNPLWSGSFYALDIYHPEVREYIKRVFDTVIKEWGFEMVKLDFLYGACLLARNGRSRGGVMQDAMELLREAVGDKEILGCGIPIGTAPGMTDYCRIGADIHLKWEFGLLKWLGNRERVSTILALQNTIHRRHLNNFAFINDPDVFILRKKKQQLTTTEQYTLLLVNLLFGDLLFTSDYIADYDETARNLFQSIFPLLPKKDIQVEYTEGFYRVSFGIGERRYLALINLSERDRLFKLPPGLFFEPVTKEVVSNEQTIPVFRHQSVLLHLAGGGMYAVLGTDGHFFPGADIRKVVLKGDSIRVNLIEGLQRDPVVFLKIPEDAEVKYINQHAAKVVKKKDFHIVYAQLNRNETDMDND
jgi:alpha-galactosidase